jgi:hypothetical protein
MRKSGMKRKRRCQADLLFRFRRTTVHPTLYTEVILDDVERENAFILLYAIIVCAVFYLACFLRFYDDVQFTIKREDYALVPKATPALVFSRLLLEVETMHENYIIQEYHNDWSKKNI